MSTRKIWKRKILRTWKYGIKKCLIKTETVKPAVVTGKWIKIKKRKTNMQILWLEEVEDETSFFNGEVIRTSR